MDTTDSVAGSVTQLSAAAEEFSRTLEQITGNADRQRTRAQETTTQVQNLERAYQSAASTMEEVTTSASENSRVSTESVAVVAATIEEVDGITADLKTIGQQVRAAGEASAGVDSIVSTVRDISDRTALLAMNAATAAESRAGRIDQSTKRAQESLGIVTKNASAVVTSVSHIRTTFQEQSEAIQKVQAAMEDVDQLSASVLEAIDEQSRGAAEMVDSITTIKESIEEVRTVSASISQIGETLTAESTTMEREVSEYRA